MLKQSPEYRWYNAYQAYNRAKNPTFKQYWYGVMQHLKKQFS